MPWPTVLALALAAGALLLYARERRAKLSVKANAEESDRRHVAEVLRMERDRQAALDRVDAAERRFAHVTDAAPAAMLIVASTGRVERANPAAATLLGTSLDDLAGCAARDLARDGHAVRHDGRQVRVQMTKDAWKEAGEAWSVVWLRDAPAPHAVAPPSTRLASIGLACLDAAEHVRAPLASLRMSAQLAEDELRAGLGRPEGRLAAAVMTALSHQETLMTDIDRLERIAKTLDEATRAPDGTPDAVDVNALAEGALSRARLAGGIRVHKELLASAPALAVAAEVTQVIDALVRNAAEALEAEGGDLTVLTMDTPERVVVEVTDTAPLDHRKDARGMWLPAAPGHAPQHLTTGHATLDAHGGRISFMAHPGQGATFRVEMPRRSGPI